MKTRLAKCAPQKLKDTLRSYIPFLRWLSKELPRRPLFELYSRRMSRLNGQFFRQMHKPGANQTYLDPFKPAKLPKTVWLYWHEPENDAPPLVRRCFESWRQCNPDWDVRVLNGQTAFDVVDMSDVPEVLPHRYFANVLRLRLLAQYGGVWTDATTYCHQPLNSWLPLHAISGFFAFRDPAPDRWIENWFLVSEPNHALVSSWEAFYSEYVRPLPHTPDKYFMCFYAFQWCLKNSPELDVMWKRVPSLPAQPTFVMAAALQGHIPFQQAYDVIAQGVPVSKLTWKKGIGENMFSNFCDGLPPLPPDHAKIAVAEQAS